MDVSVNQSQQYLYALASGDQGHSVIRLPIKTDRDGSIKVAEGQSVLGGQGAWEQVGQYPGLCPKTLVNRSTQQFVPLRLQNLEVLEDDGLVFTSDRSHIVLRYPSHLNSAKDRTCPELVIDVRGLLSPDFDDREGLANQDYGISLAYNPDAGVVYAGIEDQVYCIDLVQLAKRKSQQSIEVQPGSAAVSADSGADSGADFFYPLKDSSGRSPVVSPGASSISLALCEDSAGKKFLFDSHTAPAIRENPFTATPVKVAELETDGRRVKSWDEPAFNKALQYSSLSIKSDGTQEGNGLRSDVTFLATESRKGAAPVLVAHVHHNHPVVIGDPHKKYPDVEAKMAEMEANGTMSDQTMHPDAYSKMLGDQAAGFYRLHNITINFDDIKGNAYNIKDRVTSRLKKNKVINFNHDYFQVTHGHVMTLPWRDDPNLLVMAHKLPEGAGCGWHTQPDAAWYKVAELPPLYNMPQTPPAEKKEGGGYQVHYETFEDIPRVDWASNAVCYSAYKVK